MILEGPGAHIGPVGLANALYSCDKQIIAVANYAGVRLETHPLHFHVHSAFVCYGSID